MTERLTLRTKFRVDVYKSELLPEGFDRWPAAERARWYEGNPGHTIIEEDGNLALLEGMNALWTLACGGGGTVYSNANARCGVGDGDTAPSADQTGLQGANTAFKGMLATYPQYGSDGQAVFKSEFLSAEGNFAWKEYTVDNGAATNKNLNRRVVDHGTKASGEVRTLTVTTTIS